MPFQIIKGDLTAIPCDAIVNPSDEVLSGSGGLDAQIHRAAGPELNRVCSALVPLSIGQAVLTPAYRLPCLQIIHTVAPWWTGEDRELEGLRQCYRSTLRLVEAHGLRRIAFPLIGSGTRGFPKELVLRIAAEELTRALREQEDCELLLVIHDRSEFQPNPALLAGVERRLRLWGPSDLESTAAFPPLPHSVSEDVFSSHSASEDAFPCSAAESADSQNVLDDACSQDFSEEAPQAKPFSLPRRPRREAAAPSHPLPSAVFRPDREPMLDESFSQMVLRKIEERGFQKDSDCYTRANIDRRLFSRLRCDKNYHPKKTTALALAVALELPLPETRELLMKAGYSLSRSLLLDVIVEYCIGEGNYNIFEINELLFQYDQPLLGG